MELCGHEMRMTALAGVMECDFCGPWYNRTFLCHERCDTVRETLEVLSALPPHTHVADECGHRMSADDDPFSEQPECRDCGLYRRIGLWCAGRCDAARYELRLRLYEAEHGLPRV